MRPARHLPLLSPSNVTTDASATVAGLHGPDFPRIHHLHLQPQHFRDRSDPPRRRYRLPFGTAERPAGSQHRPRLRYPARPGRTDVLAVFDRSDEQIRKEVADDVICPEFGAAPRQFAVTVQAGLVTLEGSAETAALGHVIVRKVRHVQERRRRPRSPQLPRRQRQHRRPGLLTRAIRRPR